MPQNPTIFMTGLTGYLGCHLAHNLLCKGYHVIALVREGRDGQTVQERAEQALRQVDPDMTVPFDQLTAVAGSVQELDDALIARIRQAAPADQIDEVWHCAATFKFHEEDRPEIKAINIEGVRHILKLVQTVNLASPPRYFHVSTAYSCGREYPSVPEAFTPDSRTFRTLYEWSKHEGEARVVQSQAQAGLDATIFRPAIIVGSPETRVFNDSAYYQVCSAFYRLRKHYADKRGAAFDGHIDVRMMADPDTRLNFVPVDYVVEAMLQLSQIPALATEDLKVFNIVNEDPPTLGFVHHHLCDSLGVTGFDVVREEDFGEATSRFERALARNIAFQTPYMSDDIGFDTTAYRRYVPAQTLPNPVIDHQFLGAINKRFFDTLAARTEEKNAASLS
ncbi:MAG: SDR family oxidoreductase [Anaerolineales bacterium]|nr:SDR family oxidoreductase [Anaerolineales bacterium]